MKKRMAIVCLLMTIILAFCACTPAVVEEQPAGKEPDTAAVADGPTAMAEKKDPSAPDYEHMNLDELYELAKAEGGVIRVYATSASANTAIKKMQKVYPDLQFEYISCDTDTIAAKIEMEADTGNTNELLRFGLPLYSTFYPWFYNTAMFPDGPGIESWWDIVAGYNVDTRSYVDADGNNTQKWTIFSKDVTGPSYASLFAQMILDSDMLREQYRNQYGEDLVITYTDALQNVPGIMEFPEDNAGVELFWRFSQMAIIPNPDGDGVVEAVDKSLNGPTLGLCSASKVDNARQGYHIAWVTGLAPYTGFMACNYSYVVKGCDNPAGARLYILFMMGGEDGKSGCYEVFDNTGYWSIRDDVAYTDTDLTAEDVVLGTPDFAGIYDMYPNVKAYWTYWHSLVQ